LGKKRRKIPQSIEEIASIFKNPLFLARYSIFMGSSLILQGYARPRLGGTGRKQVKFTPDEPYSLRINLY